MLKSPVKFIPHPPLGVDYSQREMSVVLDEALLGKGPY